MFNPRQIKNRFPIFKRLINGKPLSYLDNASTTQKPQSVIDALVRYYSNTNSNIHRGIHTLSQEATAAYESARQKTARFINAKSEKEIVFTRNTTESINLIAKTWGEQNLKAGDEIVVSALEHHSNLVPWQELAKRKNATLTVIPLKDDYTLETWTASPQTKLLAITGMSNVLGTIPPVKTLIAQAHKVGALTLVDGAQSVAHSPTDVQDLDCDFLAFSGHKMLGPTGVGILYMKESLAEKIPPFLHGGDMVKVVGQYEATWNDIPWKFEAGTPNIADVVAFTEALDFLTETGLEQIANHERQLLKQAHERFSKYPQVKLHCPKNGGGILSFSIHGVHPHDIAEIFNREGVAIRSGHHCNQPLMERLGIPATARLSFYLYNDDADIDRAETALKNVIKLFK